MHSELRWSVAMQSEQTWQPSPALGLPRTVAAIKDGLSSFHPNGPPALSCWQNKLYMSSNLGLDVSMQDRL